MFTHKNFLTLAVCIHFYISAAADVPPFINYQGRLTNSAGISLADSTYSVTFAIYDQPSGGNNLWSETQDIATADGLFTTLLGTTNPLVDSIFNGAEIYLGTKVNPNEEFSPRDRIVSTGYSYRVSSVDGASGGNIASKLTVAGSIRGDSLLSSILYGSSSIQLSANSSTRMVIQSDGDVGIGTSTPGEKLSVAGSMEIGTSSSDYQHLRIGGGNSSGFLYGSYPAFGDGIHLGYNWYSNFVGAGIIPNGGGAYSRISVGYGYIGMYVGSSLIPPATLGVYVNDLGDVGIGTNVPFYQLDVAGSAHASSFPTSSDNRLKKNIRPLTGVLEKLEKISGVSFDWNETYEKMGRSTGHREIGVIAQEVETVFPELVTTWGDENYRAVDYSRLSAVLIEAIKEQQKEIGSLTSEVQELKNSLQKLASSKNGKSLEVATIKSPE